MADFGDPYRGSAGFWLSDGGRWSVGRRIAVGGSDLSSDLRSRRPPGAQIRGSELQYRRDLIGRRRAVLLELPGLISMIPYRGSAGFGLSEGGQWSVGRRIAVGGSVGARIRVPSDRPGLRSEVLEHRFWRPWALGLGFRLGLQPRASGLGFSLGLALQPWASDRRDQRDRADGGLPPFQRLVYIYIYIYIYI